MIKNSPRESVLKRYAKIYTRYNKWYIGDKKRKKLYNEYIGLHGYCVSLYGDEYMAGFMLGIRINKVR